MNVAHAHSKLIDHGFKASIDRRGDRINVGGWKSLYRFTVRYSELSNSFKVNDGKWTGPLNIALALFGLWQLISMFINMEGGKVVYLLFAPLAILSLVLEVLRFLFQPSAERSALNIINS